MGCPYANIIGAPGQGVHATRFLGMALVDWLVTIVLALLFSYFFKINFVYSLLGWFILGEILHYVYGVKSAVLLAINLEPTC
jgi:hypothetical protein